MPELELTVERVAVGGDGIAHGPDGRVVFVEGGLPGERVRADLHQSRRDFGRARVLEVLDPAPGRRTAPCPHGRAGCGGCGWQHVEPGAQRSLKQAMVADALRRQGGRPDLEVALGPTLPDSAFRTTVRLAVHGEHPAFRAGGSHDLVDVDDCGVAHPLLAPLIARGRFPGAQEAVLRAGAATGERLVVLHPGGRPAGLPADVVVVAAGAEGDAAVHEDVAGHRFRIGAASFFQTRPDGAAALVEVVAAALAGAPDDGTFVDAYSGVGLFGVALGGPRRVVAVEQAPSSVADARHNLAGRDARAVRADVARWRPEPAAVVVADPARAGLGREAAAVLAATGAAHLALVSCDAGALGRDVRLLEAAGYRATSCTLVDLFPHTPHVEVVTGFRRG